MTKNKQKLGALFLLLGLFFQNIFYSASISFAKEANTQILSINDDYDYKTNDGQTNQEINEIFKASIIHAREVRKEIIDSDDDGYIAKVKEANDVFKYNRENSIEAKKEAKEALKKEKGNKGGGKDKPGSYTTPYIYPTPYQTPSSGYTYPTPYTTPYGYEYQYQYQYQYPSPYMTPQESYSYQYPTPYVDPYSYETPYSTPYQTPYQYPTPNSPPYITPYAYQTPYTTPELPPYPTPYQTPVDAYQYPSPYSYQTPYQTPEPPVYPTPPAGSPAYETPYNYQSPYTTPYPTPYTSPSDGNSEYQTPYITPATSVEQEEEQPGFVETVTDFIQNTTDNIVVAYYEFVPPGLQDALENPLSTPRSVKAFGGGLAANISDNFGLELACKTWTEQANSQNYGAFVVAPGCSIHLGDNPITYRDIVNNGTVYVGKGVWKIDGIYIQKMGGRVVVSGEAINLAVGTIVINNTKISGEDIQNSSAGRVNLVFHNFLDRISGQNCNTLTLTKVIVDVPAGGLDIISNCNFPNDIVPFDLAPTLAILAVPFTFFPALQNLVLSVSGFGDLWNLFARFIGNILSVFGLKRKRKYWGTVYDSVTKQPLDPVVVRLQDAESGKVVEQAISDLYGHFGFLVRRGKFVLSAEKNGYAFPSQKSMGQEDEIYSHLYHGETIEIKSETDVITPNIPMDRLRYDFNQEAKKKIIRFHPWVSWSVYVIMAVLFWLGFLASVFNLILEPNAKNMTVLGVYLVLAIYRVFWPHKRIWGRVTDGHRKAMPNLVLELNFPTIANVIVGKAKTEIDGKYFLKAQPGKYILKIKKLGEDEVLFTKNIEIKKSGVLNELIKI